MATIGSVTKHDFDALLWPHIETCTGILPGNTALRDAAWRAVSAPQSGSRAISAALFKEFATLNYDFERVGTVIGSAVHALRVLLDCRERGYLVAHGMSAHDACSTCTESIRGREYWVSELLAAYTDPGSSVPILPHAACAQLPLGGWCRCLWLPGYKLKLMPIQTNFP